MAFDQQQESLEGLRSEDDRLPSAQQLALLRFQGEVAEAERPPSVWRHGLPPPVAEILQLFVMFVISPPVRLHHGRRNERRIVMTLRTIGLLVIGVLVCGFTASGTSRKVDPLVAGGSEAILGQWTPGRGSIQPGAKIRGWTAPFQDVLVGPAGEFASGSGPVTMNCNLDESLTGPCWGGFEFENAKGTWVGTWLGTFNFATGAGSYRAVGHGQGGLKGLVLENDVVFPGYAFAVNGVPTGYIYSTVSGGRGH
jgi:hypothetical protein